MLVKIGNTDITPLINESSYDVNSEPTYKSWLDGNYHEHRVYTSSPVSGTFDVVLGEIRGTTLSQLWTLFNNASDASGHLVQNIVVYLNNEGTTQRIDAYWSLKAKTRRKLSDGNYLETITVTIKEK